MIKKHGFLTSALMIALAAVFVMPVSFSTANAQDPYGRWENGRWVIRQQDDDWRYRNNRRNRRNRRAAADGYSDFGGSYQLRQTALNAGFNEGLKEGRRDRQRGEYGDWRDEDKFQRATTDYSSKLGDRELYRAYFRQAFENGYKDGYSGY